jgi:H+-transporting ATPase
MGSAIKRGESKAVVVATGANTFFGKAAALIGSVQHTSRFQVILFRLTLTLLVLCLVIAGIIFVKLEINQPDTVVKNISTVVVILVASIPIAIEVICTSTLAVGSRRLAQKRIIVARLSAIEELAGMNILCSDKTGTLTLNELELRAPILFTSGVSADEVLFLAALASKREQGNQDAIDLCVTRALPERERTRLHAHEELAFEPFNPTDKRTEATVRSPGAGGGVFKVTKGAPQYILRMAHNKAALKEGVDSAVQELADRGFRALGLAVSRAAPGEPDRWEFVAVMSLFDPPRPDTKATIAAAIENGIEVKMVTGDQTAIAKETCRELGMGTNILNTDVLNHAHMPQSQVDEVILNSHGFAEVMPEHKFQIVERLRAFGIDIARRTVAKYRESMRIPSSVERRRMASAS